MTRHHATPLRLSVAALLAAFALCANAQTPGTSGDTTTRAHTKADLKTLEQKGGYRPQASDPSYPNDVQAAERKAYGASGPIAGAPAK